MNVREVTITTKYGLNPPKPSLLRRFARTVLQPFPALKRRLQSDPPNVFDESLEDPSMPPFNAVEAQRSIDQSLRNLGVNTIDLLLLHEATPGRLQDPALLETLERNVVAGKIRQFGIGSRSKRVLACVQDTPSIAVFCNTSGAYSQLHNLPWNNTPASCMEASVAAIRLRHCNWIFGHTL
jgi:aryl-alcohol dehydrogenase-like predicted oxidoreductase